MATNPYYGGQQHWHNFGSIYRQLTNSPPAGAYGQDQGQGSMYTQGAGYDQSSVYNQGGGYDQSSLYYQGQNYDQSYAYGQGNPIQEYLGAYMNNPLVRNLAASLPLREISSVLGAFMPYY